MTGRITRRVKRRHAIQDELGEDILDENSNVIYDGDSNPEIVATKRVTAPAAVASFDPWGGSWGTSWGLSWIVSAVVSAFTILATRRVVRTYAIQDENGLDILDENNNVIYDGDSNPEVVAMSRVATGALSDTATKRVTAKAGAAATRRVTETPDADVT